MKIYITPYPLAKGLLPSSKNREQRILVESVGDVLVVSVPEQRSKPYSFSGKFYLREGASSQQLVRDEIRSFFFQEGLIHFDEMICDRFDIATNLTEDYFLLFAKRAKIPSGLPPLQVLENLHLVRDHGVTNTAAWLLTEDISSVSSSAHISCAVFQGVFKVLSKYPRKFIEKISRPGNG